MATVRYSLTASSSINPWYGSMTSGSLTTIVWDGTDSGGTAYQSIFRGTGFTYHNVTGAVQLGVITELDQTVDGNDYLSITDFKITAAAVQSFWNLGDYNGFLRAIFAGNDRIFGTNNDDVLVGYGGGRDTISGGIGDDTIYGGADNDSIVGGNGNDEIHTGGGAMDTVSAGNGDDNIYATGYAQITGGSGSDTYYLETGVARITESSSASGIDEVVTQYSYRLPNNVEYLRLIGDTDASAMGNASDNLIVGNDGDNTIGGGLGTDTLSGGDAGKDVFLFDSKPNATTNVDTILGFVDTGLESDRIAFDQTAFVGFKYYGNISSRQFLDLSESTEQLTTTRIQYDPTTGELFYDRDGLGTPSSDGLTITNRYAPILIAIIGEEEHPDLNYRDFFVVQ